MNNVICENHACNHWRHEGEITDTPNKTNCKIYEFQNLLSGVCTVFMPDGTKVNNARRRKEDMSEVWISVEDRLPEKGQDVAFILNEPSNDHPVARFAGKYKGKDPGQFFALGKFWDALHWKPLSLWE